MMSYLFRKYIVPNLFNRFIRTSCDLSWHTNYNNLYRIGLKNEVMIPIKTFGPIYIESTEKKNVSHGDVILTIETDKTILNLLSPFDGKIIGFNNNFMENVNKKSNYDEIFSWVVAIKKNGK